MISLQVLIYGSEHSCNAPFASFRKIDRPSADNCACFCIARSEAEYKQVFDQMAKMRMNTFALHEYGVDRYQVYGKIGPVCGNLASPEPTVWFGLPGEYDPATGEVNTSYPTTYVGAHRSPCQGVKPFYEFCFFLPCRYSTAYGWTGKETAPGVWGPGSPGQQGRPMKTSEYTHGLGSPTPWRGVKLLYELLFFFLAGMAFSADNFGSEAQMKTVANQTLSKPMPGAQSNELINR